MLKNSLSQDRLKELLDYNSETGIFVWRVDRGGTAKLGSVAGRVNSSGHIQIMVDGVRYLAHRLAWVYVYGNHPCAEIDHINRVKTDNRISNLREARTFENQQNRTRSSNNKSGVSDVCWCHKNKKWRVRIASQGRRHHIGYFADFDEAKNARSLAKKQFHTFHPIDC